MTAVSVLGLGELLWDCFPDRRLPGGAPANVAFHAQQLGLSAATVTRVGCDPLGDEICEFLKSRGLCLDLVQRDPLHGTGTVTVEAGGTTEATAAATKYTFKPDSAWDFLEPTPPLLEAMRAAQAVCFGTLAQRCPVSRGAIHTCLAAASNRCLIVYDVNLRPPFFEREWIERSLHRARIAKLNDDEVRVLAVMLDAGVSDNERFARWLMSRYDLELVCVTRGAAGCLLVGAGDVVDEPGVPVDVIDTVGAGDAFTAALIQTRLEGWPLRRSAEFANRVGSLVAGSHGAMPVLTDVLPQLRARTGFVV
jgi:fructokinase